MKCMKFLLLMLLIPAMNMLGMEAPQTRTFQLPTGTTPEHQLRIAAGNNRYEEAQELLKNHPSLEVNDGDKHGGTALMWAASRGKVAMINLLVQHGAAINQQDNEKNTPLIWACKNHMEEAVETLIALGADPNIQNNRKKTALYWVTSKELLTKTKSEDKTRILAKKKRMVCALIAGQANLNVTDESGSTPLHWAASNGLHVVLEELCKAGAAVDRLNTEGLPALFYAITGQQPKATRVLLHWASKQGCLADLLSWTDTKKQGLVFCALIAEQYDTIKKLVTYAREEGIPGHVLLNAPADSGSALYAACDSYKPEIIRLLAECAGQTYINTQDSIKGRTPLAMVLRMTEGAVKKSGEQMSVEQAAELIAILRSYGARIDLVDAFGKTVTDWVGQANLTEEKKQVLYDALFAPIYHPQLTDKEEEDWQTKFDMSEYLTSLANKQDK